MKLNLERRKEIERALEACGYKWSIYKRVHNGVLGYVSAGLGPVARYLKRTKLFDNFQIFKIIKVVGKK